MGLRGKKPTPPLERIMRRVERQGECLVYMGHRTPGGYGWVNAPGGPRSAHRLVWAAHNPDNPEPEAVMHTCDNRPCVEITHLRAGTYALNNADAAAKGRMARQRGELSGKAKLTAAQVREIRRRRAAGETCASIAPDFGVDHAHVSRIARGLRWPGDSAYVSQESCAEDRGAA